MSNNTLKIRGRTVCQDCPSRENSLLKDLSVDELNIIESSKTTHIVRKKQPLFTEGDSVDSMYCIASGRVKLTKKAPTNSEQLIQLAGSGDLLNSAALAGENTHSLTARALETTEVCRLDPRPMVELMERSPSLLRNFLRKMNRTLSQNENTIFSLSYGTVRERVARALLALDRQFGMKADDGSLIDVRLTREEFASLAGTVLESAVRTLSEFKAKGVIATKGRSITILKRDRLDRIAQGKE